MSKMALKLHNYCFQPFKLNTKLLKSNQEGFSFFVRTNQGMHGIIENYFYFIDLGDVR